MSGDEIIEAIIGLGGLFLAMSVIAFIFILINTAIDRARHGKSKAPDEYDEIIDGVEKIASSGLRELKKGIDSLKSQKSKINNISEKIRLINELELLKTNGLVSDEEYQSLRNKIMK